MKKVIPIGLILIIILCSCKSNDNTYDGNKNNTSHTSITESSIDQLNSNLNFDEYNERFSEVTTDFNRTKNNYRKKHITLPEYSTEGTKIIGFLENENIKKVRAKIYRETGRNMWDFYYNDNILFIEMWQYDYNYPVNYYNSHSKEEDYLFTETFEEKLVEERRYIMDRDEHMIFQLLDSESKIIISHDINYLFDAIDEFENALLQ